ncbi:MAG: hypothetical protein PHD02_04075 [Bacilli bacterium]|nr:hypothetical protein [Bacilli bacterium]
MKKGFTMIEMLGIVVLIALISLFSFPAINTLTKNASTQKYNNFIKILDTAADTYIEYNFEKYDNMDEQYISTKTLIENGYLSETLINPNTKTTVLDENGIIIITKNIDRSLNYEYSLNEYFVIDSIEALMDLEVNVNSGNNYSNKIIILSKDLDFKDPNSYVDSTTTAYGDINGDGNTSQLIVELTTIKGFKPIGNSSNSFEGTFNGDMYTINNLYINRSLETEVGLFGYISGAKITNLNINGTVNGSDNTGLIVGSAVSNSEISNINADFKTYYSCPSCTVINVGGIAGIVTNTTVNKININIQINLDASSLGGLIGRATDSTVSNIIESGSINSSKDNIGGIIGYATNTSLSDIEASGKIVGGNYVGGIFGKIENALTINNLANKASVTGINQVGGIAGTVSNSTLTYSNNSAIIEGTSNVGGIAGTATGATIELSNITGNITGINQVGGIVGTSTDTTILNNYIVNNVEGTNQVGGIIGYMASSTITNNYISGTITASSECGGLIGLATNSSVLNYSFFNTTKNSTIPIIGTNTSSTNTGSSGLTNEQMKDAEYYTNWDFINTWKIENNFYPTLRNE